MAQKRSSQTASRSADQTMLVLNRAGNFFNMFIQKAYHSTPSEPVESNSHSHTCLFILLNITFPPARYFSGMLYSPVQIMYIFSKALMRATIPVHRSVLYFIIMIDLML